MDTLTTANPPRSLVLGGATYAVANLTFEAWSEIQVWICEHCLGPVVKVHLQLRQAELAGCAVPAADRREMLGIAEDRAWPPNYLTPAWFECLEAPGGKAAFCAMALRDHNLGFTRQRAAELAARLTPGEFLELVRAAYGLIPRDEAEADPDPKAGTAPSTGAPSSAGSANSTAGVTGSAAG
jgi:hypothetical protein